MLKMKPCHYMEIARAIDQVLVNNPELPEKYRLGQFHNADKCKDLAMRYRWDMFWKAKDRGLIKSNFYSYLNDDHIDSALRDIFKTRLRP